MGKKLTLMLFILLSHSDSSEQFCKIEMKNKRTHFGGRHTSVSCVTDKSMSSPPRLSPHCKAGQTEQIINATDYFTHLFICSTNAHWMPNVSQNTPCTRDIVMNRLEQKGKGPYLTCSWMSMYSVPRTELSTWQEFSKTKSTKTYTWSLCQWQVLTEMHRAMWRSERDEESDNVIQWLGIWVYTLYLRVFYLFIYF